jgi:uncharacterized protein
MKKFENIKKGNLDMNKKLSHKYPLLYSILLALLTIIFMTIAGIIITIRKSSEEETYIVLTLVIWVSAFVGLLIMKKSKYSMKDFGFNFYNKLLDKKLLWLIPIILIEALPFITGLNHELSTRTFFILVFFTIGVGVNEEVYYRGLILKLLEVKGVKYAIINSSVIFGVAHIFNALNGKDPFYLILQILFATVFGLVCAEIVILKKTIILPIIWHTLHDLISISTSQEVGTSMAHIIISIQFIILIFFSIYLWINIKKSKTEMEKISY